jgi:hypothetical protein
MRYWRRRAPTDSRKATFCKTLLAKAGYCDRTGTLARTVLVSARNNLWYLAAMTLTSEPKRRGEHTVVRCRQQIEVATVAGAVAVLAVWKVAVWVGLFAG